MRMASNLPVDLNMQGKFYPTIISHISDQGVHYEFKDAYHTSGFFRWRRQSIEGDRKMKSIVIGIMSQEKIRERIYAIAKGEYKPKQSEPKIWFTSMKSLAEVLSDDNRALLHVIKDAQPESISSLAQMTGRKPSNLSRTLKTLSNYGIVEMRREKNFVRPIANATDFQIMAAWFVLTDIARTVMQPLDIFADSEPVQRVNDLIAALARFDDIASRQAMHSGFWGQV